MYIIGFPKDDEKTINNTIDYAVGLNTTYAQFAVWTPYPGTPIYESYKDKIFVKNYEDFTQYNLVFNHNNLKPQEIRRLLSKAYTKYYFRFNWMYKFTKSFLEKKN